ncbi:endo-1,4-beta-xylanase [Candidatus Bathyarchaeota archaeon]|nr:endo-1,4-beta-xylanase [Candidatus Bathyarchaeota archaeon]
MKAAALLMAAASAAAMPFLEIETNDLETRQAIANIDALFKEKGKLYFGTCADGALLTNEQNSGVIQSTFGQLTPENSMKWDQVNSAEGPYNWEGGDALVEYAVANGLSVRGHTLVWHSQLASWVEGVTDPAALTTVIQEHVAAVVGRWKGQIRAWDVVNEMFNEDGSLRPSVFSDVLGEDFVRIAFEAAREADPDAILYINDYNLDDPTYAKTTIGMADHVTKWIADGVPIDGIGECSPLPWLSSRV